MNREIRNLRTLVVAGLLALSLAVLIGVASGCDAKARGWEEYEARDAGVEQHHRGWHWWSTPSTTHHVHHYHETTTHHAAPSSSHGITSTPAKATPVKASPTRLPPVRFKSQSPARPVTGYRPSPAYRSTPSYRPSYSRPSFSGGRR